MISAILLLAVTSFSVLGLMEYNAYGKKDFDQSQVSKQNSNCKAGEDNNNSCNNFDLKEMISDRLKMLRQTWTCIYSFDFVFNIEFLNPIFDNFKTSKDIHRCEFEYR